jgi:hypothetical protein
MADHVLGRPSVQFRKIQVLAVVSFWSFYLFRYLTSPPTPTMLTIAQRSQAWPAYDSKIITKAQRPHHALADPRHNPPLPLHSTKLGQTRRPRMSRTPREPIYSIILPRNMGDDGNGCGVLDCYADKEEMAERYC